MLLKYLQFYPNKTHAKLLIHGFSNGFRLGHTGPRTHFLGKNLASAELNAKIVLEKLTKEVLAGRMAGPFNSPPFPNLRISPVGLVPKADGTFRLITHLSYPKCNLSSVNANIIESFKTVKYTSFDRVVDMVFNLGEGALMAKRDIKSAFRLLPIHPDDFNLLGIQINGRVFVDKNLPFGCSCAPFLFECFSTFIHWAVTQSSKLDTLDHYIDDFILCGRKGTGDCRKLIAHFNSTCSELGVPINDEKSEGPTTVMTFLGLVIDSDNMLIRIPQPKIIELQALLTQYLQSKKISLQDLQSLAGKLSFFGRAIRTSRAFTRRFYNAMAGVKKSFYKIRITDNMKEDIKIWLEFLSEFNGTCLITDKLWYDSETLKLFTDSAGTADLGCGCYLSGKWSFFQWPSHWGKCAAIRDITFLEMVPVLLAVTLWRHDLKNRRVLLHIDNSALVAVINNQTSKSKRVMRLVRQFVLVCMRNNIIFKAVHLSSKENFIADLISRKQWNKLPADVQLSPIPEVIPASFRTMISDMKLSA